MSRAATPRVSSEAASEEDERLLDKEERNIDLAAFDYLDEVVDENDRSYFAVAVGALLAALAALRSFLRLDTLMNALLFLRPSFLAPSDGKPKKTHPTAYLDGMRGMAAFIVVIYHLSSTPFDTDHGWGFEKKNYDFIKLPFVRLAISGSVGVALFFVISGYALSYRPMKLLLNGQTLDGHQALASTLLRRWARLFLPTAVSTFMIMLLIQAGAYEPLRNSLKQKKYWRFHMEKVPAQQKTFSAELWHWMGQQRQIWDVPGSPGKGVDYDSHLWTIPFEFRNSLYLFLAILGTSKLRRRYRVALIGFVMLYVWGYHRWDTVLFLSGMLIAEWDHASGAHLPPSVLPSTHVPKKTPAWQFAFWVALNFLSMFLMGVPDRGCVDTPFYKPFCRAVPWESKQRWWQALGVIPFVITVPRLWWWKKFYETPVVQYLGRISYSLYLMHGMVLKSVGMPLELWIWRHVTGIKGYNRLFGWVLGALFTVSLAIWLADIFMRLIDIPAVKFTKWVESKVTKQD